MITASEINTSIMPTNPETPLVRETPAPWRQFGAVNLEAEAIRQMEAACRLPNAVCGALMPDAHTGYGLPIGGVLAVKGAVVPYAVGMDIACRMRLTVTDLPIDRLERGRDELIAALENETSFGIGAGFKAGLRDHAVMEEADWSVTKVTRDSRDKAGKQLGTSGSGNHFVEFGELSLTAPALGLAPGRYLALLSHSGSRGTGERVAIHYSKVAGELLPGLPDYLKHLAWLELTSEAGQEYWTAMQLMGRYAAANHELIHAHVLKAAGAGAMTFVENHHNFAWLENHGGEEVVVHRKGATPASKGVLGIVPGSMGAPGFVVRGRGEASSLNSCSHGAGRLMSRSAALKRFSHDEVRAYLTQKKVHLISGGLDEAPMAYKDINEVMAAQSELVDILARFEPRIVKMAPPDGHNRRGKRRK
ncbi:RNA-splicing ligase RtcB [Deltaproteobacteria bacterium Smac51]|nr:RNA-splicing ligase RtcB [Deltaproteobacteria bacterium Smac51]